MRNDEGTTPLASPGMHALRQHFDAQRSACQSAQRGRCPHALVIAAARIEPDDEVDAAHARRERIEIRGQIVAAAFLASLDQANAARMRDALAPAMPRWRRAPRMRRSRRRRCRGRRACRPRGAGPTGHSPRATRSSRAACRDGRRAAPCDRSCCRPERRSRGAACGRTGARSPRRVRARSASSPTLRRAGSRARCGRWPATARRNAATSPVRARSRRAAERCPCPTARRWRRGGSLRS